jgi:hypothetical protein
MRTLRFRLTILLMFVAVSAALAADVTGKWVAQVPMRDGQTREVVFNLKADGSQLTRGEMQISEGKINGDEISFTQVMDFNGNQFKLLYKGKVSGDEIKFTREREGGNRSQEFTAKKSS